MTTISIPPGAVVRVVRSSESGESAIDASAATPGAGYMVFAFVDGLEGDDPNGKSYYLLDRPDRTSGGAYWAYGDNIDVLQGATDFPEGDGHACMPARLEVVDHRDQEGLPADDRGWEPGEMLELIGLDSNGSRIVAVVEIVEVADAGP